MRGSSPRMAAGCGEEGTVVGVPMFKLVTILAALIPVILFLKNVFFRRSKVLQQASSEFRKQVDYLVWGILFLIGLGLLYSLGRLVYSMWG